MAAFGSSDGSTQGAAAAGAMEWGASAGGAACLLLATA